jgi:CRISPR-associated endoribonuclease Cas6
MPTLVNVPLHADPDTPFPATPHRALQATFYSWLQAGDAGLSARVHDVNGPKPFTVAPLFRRDGVLQFQFTLLDDALWSPLEAALQRGAAVEMVNDRWPVASDGWLVTRCSYTDLFQRAATGTRLTFRFRSPTSFRSHEMHYPLPDPLLCFQSWLMAWNTCAPAEVRINVSLLDVVAAHVAISRYRLRTEPVEFGPGRMVIGFAGEVSYQVIRAHKLGENILRKLNALADYAVFCGTGVKTTQGLGQTRRMR